MTERYKMSFHDRYMRAFHMPIIMHDKLDAPQSETCTTPCDKSYIGGTRATMYRQP